MPLGAQEELTWGSNANCYAYAMNCSNPTNGHLGGAVPGAQAAAAGHAAAAGATIVQQVVADGGGVVTVAAGTPLAPPADVVGSYVIAALTNAMGFHFIRRDSTTGRWSWKDGNGGTVKYNVLDTGHNMYVYINSGNLNDILVSRKAAFAPWAYASMTFQAFFRVPDGGRPVRR